MKVEQLYTSCLAQGAYYIESEGEAAIIDPLREVQQYLDLASQRESKIKYIFETHFHADFVSGHVTLSKKTGAPIIYGPKANPGFEAIVARDGQIFQLGKISIEVLHTPGHTLESSCYLLKDESGINAALFTGDTLFLGDVGRPDLAQNGSLSMRDLAGMSYDSLRNKILPLNDELVIYPGHGAGSACGKNMMKETVDTLGNQRIVNYALRSDMSKEEFIEEVLSGLGSPPAYFPENVQLNKLGYEDVDSVLIKSLNPLEVDEFNRIRQSGNTTILDVRHQNDFKQGHVPGSIFIGLNGTFAPWVGELLKNTTRPLAIVATPGQEEEAIVRLARVGFDNVLGYLKGGYNAWLNAGLNSEHIDTISASDFSKVELNENNQLVDVRRPSEFEVSRVHGAINLPLSVIPDNKQKLPNEKLSYIQCLGGYRSVIAASLLKAQGNKNVVDVEGGLQALEQTDIAMSLCPSSQISS